MLAVDPTRRRGGGALLGDRIRMNALGGEHVFFRSLATRGARELPERIEAIIGACQAAGYDLVILETPGIGQGDAAVVPLADVALYVMTPEFGAASQLEKIDMLDFADVVAINKFERRGAADALRDVSRQLIRNRSAFGARPQDMPVFGTSAATFNDNGVTALYQHLAGLLAARGLPLAEGVLPVAAGRTSTDAASVIPPARTGYLAEIAGTVRGYHAETARQAQAVRRVQRLAAVRAELVEDDDAERSVASLLDQAQRDVGEDSAALVAGWPAVVDAYSGPERLLRIRDRELRTELSRESLSGTAIPRVALPRYADHGDLLRFLREENLPGYLSFFFSNGMDPEYTVIGRVARRIWAVAMRDRYGANERSQKLKYHVQTSGRSLHAQEMAFNDIRTTLQALCAIYDNCNNLHTNAYDEAVTTPSEESVRRALAIQLVINREWGLAMNENPLQGSFIVDELTDLVEEAVLAEFEAISARGGVLGAMETGYQRGRIQDESMLYEQRKHDGTLPLIGVNTFRNPAGTVAAPAELARATEEEKKSQLERVHDFTERHRDEAHADLAALKEVARSGGNVFAVLMDAARVCSLQQITEAFFEVGGQYRRNI